MGIYLLGIDVGTTHCKAGLFDQQGRLVQVASRLSRSLKSSKGFFYYDPQELWASLAAAIREIIQGIPTTQIAAVGITSMAETGMLVDRLSGAPRTDLIPWFDSSPTPQAETLRQADDLVERFCRAGIRPNFKCSLAKILWLREQDENLLREAIWLMAADTIAYQLTGVMGTDYSLAGRSYAFRIDQKSWDAPWLGSLGVDPDIFPQPLPSGALLGRVHLQAAQFSGLLAGTPVAIAGHDHVCAAFAAGGHSPGQVIDSMGTAEAIEGVFAERPLNTEDYRSGLVFGCHVVPGMNYWMGGLSASGGSVEWLRAALGDPELSYSDLSALLETTNPTPTGILYFPYLAGSGSPHSDLRVRAAFVGLDTAHRRADLARAVLEGTAYEIEFIRRVAESVIGMPVEQITVSGGGTRNPHWMQIKADVSGCRLEALDMPEATLLGAALVAGVGCGVYPDAQTALASVDRSERTVYLPDSARHKVYSSYYEIGFLALQSPLRATAQELARMEI
jgi:xylulokinase